MSRCSDRSRRSVSVSVRSMAKSMDLSTVAPKTRLLREISDKLKSHGGAEHSRVRQVDVSPSPSPPPTHHRPMQAYVKSAGPVQTQSYSVANLTTQPQIPSTSTTSTLLLQQQTNSIAAMYSNQQPKPQANPHAKNYKLQSLLRDVKRCNQMSTKAVNSGQREQQQEIWRKVG